MGAANLVADALSMGIGDYLSERAEDEYVTPEWRREGRAQRRRRRGQEGRARRVLRARGLARADATRCVDALATVDDVLVAHTMMTRLQLIPPDEWTDAAAEEAAPEEGLSLAAKKGVTTAASFAIFGATPLVAYYATVSLAAPTPELMFGASCLVTTFTLVALGAAKARLTAQPAWDSALGMVVNGGAAALAAYVIGHVLEGFQHDDGAVSSPRPRPPREDTCASGDCINDAAPSLMSTVFGSLGVSAETASVGLVAGEALCAASFAAVGALPCVFLAHSPSLTKFELACAAGFVIGILTSVVLPRLLGVEHPEDATRAPRTRSKSKWSAAQAPAAAAAGHSTVAAFALATHAAAEGVVLGAAYGNSIRAGRAALVSILAHNVPEGLATATVLRGRRKAPLAAVFVAFAATAPQALTAPLAFLFSASLGTASFAFVGFAAEKMLWIALTELLPDALLACESKFQTEKVAAVASLSALAIAVACSAL
ncbi:hypothetical protein JL720_4080 [Aureococcus anophagefferens]|nr:hypothetical protein JL720_4080 [Aureococcus anophagefferens]